MIKAIVRDGVIHPLDPLPGHWKNGREVVVDDVQPDDRAHPLADWSARMESLIAQFEPEDLERLDQILAEADVQAKGIVRRQMEAD
jgi:hypothetical protein